MNIISFYLLFMGLYRTAHETDDSGFSGSEQ